MLKEKIGFDACINAIGKDFAIANKDNMVYSYGKTDLGLYCFLGISESECQSDGLCLRSCIDEWDYYASCYVKDNDDVVMGKCKLPSLVPA